MNALSKRAKQLLQYMLQSGDYLTNQELADKLKVSSRTVIREMPSIESYVSEFGIEVEKATGKGATIKGTIDQKLLLSKSLDGIQVEKWSSASERQRFLLIELLRSNESQKLYYFSSLFNVSEATVSNDLDKLVSWLESNNLGVLRKPGYGIEILGSERNKRAAIMRLVNDTFSKPDLLSLLRSQYVEEGISDQQPDSKERLLNFIGDRVLSGVEKAIDCSGALTEYKIADSAYVALVIHLSLAVQRLLNGEGIHFDTVLLEELKESPEYDVAKQIVTCTAKEFGIFVPDDEVGYITMHLQGAKRRTVFSGEQDILVHDYELVHIAEALIMRMEDETSYSLSSHKRLATDLINHLGPALTRIRLGMDIVNPLLDQIKTQYKSYYEATLKSCALLEDRLKTTIPDAEVGFLTMHFGAAIESINQKIKLPWKAVIACSTGIGSAKLLQARVNKLYKNIKVISVLSTLDIQKKIKELDVDLMISTIPIKNAPCPMVVVSPLVLEEDAKKIEVLLSTLEVRQSSREESNNQSLVERLQVISQHIPIAVSMLERFFFETSEASEDQEIFDLVRMLADTDHGDVLVNDLMEREAIGKTIFDNGMGWLLHCNTTSVNHVQLGLIRKTKEEACTSYVMVMLIPKNLEHLGRNLVGSVNQQLFENKQLKQAIMENNKGVFIQLLENAIIEHLDYVLHHLEGSYERR